jgi:hypothetical protein
VSVGKVGEDYVVTFGVRLGTGAPRTGLVPANFVVDISDPDDSAQTTAAVAEATSANGQYRFSIPAAFTTANGVGQYGWLARVVLAPLDMIAGEVTFEANDRDDLAASIGALNDLSIADVQTALTNQGYTAARALLLDNLDATISSIASAIAALNDLSIADVQTAMTNQGYTAARAILLDNLDATISSIAAAIAALNDISITDVQTALTNQGYTTVRAALLDNLDAAVSSRSSHTAGDVDTTLTGSHGAGSWQTATLTAAAIADAVLTEAVLDHAATAGSLAEFIRIMKSLVLGNYVMDNQTYNAATKFLTGGRIRCFDTAAAVGTATEGGTGEGEFATFTVAGTEHGTVLGQPRLVKVSG